MSTNLWLREHRPLAAAHRGHSIEYPENTMEAYRKAIELGIDMIECDVNITRDGKLVMMHDSTLDRTTSGTARVSASTWEDIQRLDAGGKFKPEFSGVRVPSTEDTLLLYKETGILSCFEVKGGDADESNRIALGLAELFIKHDMLEKAFMSSYHYEALHHAKAKCPELLLAPERLPDLRRGHGLGRFTRQPQRGGRHHRHGRGLQPSRPRSQHLDQSRRDPGQQRGRRRQRLHR